MVNNNMFNMEKNDENYEQVEVGDILVSDCSDEDYDGREDNTDEIFDNIIFQENTVNDLEFEGIKKGLIDEESSDSDSESLGYAKTDSDFESVTSDNDVGESNANSEIASSSHARNFFLGQLFSNKNEFKGVVNDYSVKIGRPSQIVKNDKRRIYAKCRKIDEGCDWHINALNVNGEDSYQIREMNLTHTCARQFRVQNVKSGWLAKKFEFDFRCDPKTSAKGFRNKAITELRVHISPQQAYRARQKALKKIEGDNTDQYSKLWDYAETLKLKDPGSTVVLQLETTSTGKNFKSFYVCLAAVKRGFFSGCRPWIGVDGCHLRGPTAGVLLSAVCMDPNNDPYPLAYAVVTVENKETWEWFLQLLKEDLLREREDIYTFMSDKQKGLIAAFENVLPGVENRFCVRHLHENMKRAGFRGEQLKKLLWKAANATTVAVFKTKMLEIQKVDKSCFDWLIAKPVSQWSKSHFSTFGKCDTLVNNMCEQFNKCLLDARDKPILTMLEWVRQYMMSRIERYRNRAERKWKGRKICPKIGQIVDDLVDASADCTHIKAATNKYEVSCFEGTKYAVNLDAMTCDCRRWELSGIPCKHAISAIDSEGGNAEDYVHNCYSIDTYNAVYSHAIETMSGPELWEITGHIPPLPPTFHKRKAGRPQRQRKIGFRESPKKKKRKKNNTERLGKQKISVTCQFCGGTGHNRLGCALRKEVEIEKRVEIDVQVQETMDVQVSCAFCGESGHKLSDCVSRKETETGLIHDIEIEENTNVEGLTDVHIEKNIEVDVLDMTQPDFSNFTQDEEENDILPVGVTGQSNERPTTVMGRRMLAYKRARVAVQIKAPQPSMPSKLFTLSHSVKAQEQIRDSVLRVPAPITFQRNQFIESICAGATKSKEGEGGKMKVFTSSGKEFVPLSSLQDAAASKRMASKKK